MYAIKKRNLIFLIILVFTIGSIAGTSLIYFAGEELTGQVLITKSELADLKDMEKTYKDVDLLKQKIEEMSLYNVKEEDLILGMKRGLFDGVGDPYTNYLTKEDYASLKIMTTGQLQGIGVTVTVKDDHVEIVSTVKESPAYKAGLKSGDAILKIDDVEYDGSPVSYTHLTLPTNREV